MDIAYAVILSDLHVGRVRSPFPLNFAIHTGPREQDTTIWNLTLGQEYLLSCLDDLLLKLPKRYVLFVNGDTIQGHRDTFATRLVPGNINDQAKACAQLLKPFVKRSVASYFSVGTKFHSQEFVDCERLVAEQCEGKYSYMHNVKILDKVFNLCHGKSSVTDYPSTPLEREIADSIIKKEMKMAPHADVIVRSHIHPDSWSPLVRYNKVAFFAPAFFLSDEYLTTGLARYYRRIPLIGAVICEITEEPMPHGVKLIPIMYPVPEEELEVDVVPWKSTDHERPKKQRS